MKPLFKPIVLLALTMTIASGCQNAAPQEADSTSIGTNQATESPSAENASAEQTDTAFLSFTDFDGATVTLPKKPERIVVLNDQVLHSLYQVGGQAVGITNAFTIDPPAEAADVTKVGVMHEVNVEQVMALKPDLVIGQRFTHAEMRSIFEDAGIPFADLNTQSIEDMRRNTLLMGKITGNEQKAEELIRDMDEKINSIIGEIPDQKEMPTYAIVTVMGDAAFIEQSSTIAVDIADQLKLRNITDSLEGEVMAGYIPFSLEELVMIDPDYLFVLSHTTDEDAQKLIDTQFSSNPAWSSLSAVSGGQIYFLPKDQFVMAPGVDVVDSYRYMADLILPSLSK